MTQIFTLMSEFFKTGLFAIGGGPATIPFLMDMAQKHPWFTMSELSDMIAVSGADWTEHGYICRI